MALDLFTIGDSISQGFMSGAAARTDLAFSTLIAKHLSVADYRFPEWPAGGMLCNIENIFRRLFRRYGTNVLWPVFSSFGSSSVFLAGPSP